MAKKSFPGGSWGCFAGIIMLLYFPIGVILELAKSYGGGSSRRRRRY